MKRNRLYNGFYLLIDVEQLPDFHIREMANILLAKRGTTPIQLVGANWVTNFIKRRDKKKSAILANMTIDALNAKTLKLLKNGLIVYKSLLCNIESHRKISIILMRQASLWA